MAWLAAAMAWRQWLFGCLGVAARREKRENEK
jgi:hypothetical protein